MTKLYKDTYFVADVMQAYATFRNSKAYKPTPEQERDFVNAYNACADVMLAQLTAQQAFKALNEFVGIEGVKVEVVGSWVRLTGKTYGIKDRIKAYPTYAYNGKYRTWQIKNVPSKWSGRGMTDDEVKARHGSVTAVKAHRKATA